MAANIMVLASSLAHVESGVSGSVGGPLRADSFGAPHRLTIGGLAKHAGVSTDTIRFYERLGLMAADSRTTSGYRLFSDTAIRRLAFIKHARRCGFTLEEVRALVQTDAGSRQRLVAWRSTRGQTLKKRSKIYDRWPRCWEGLSRVLRTVQWRRPTDQSSLAIVLASRLSELEARC